jgi:hypothetical protein
LGTGQVHQRADTAAAAVAALLLGTETG